MSWRSFSICILAFLGLCLAGSLGLSGANVIDKIKTPTPESRTWGKAGHQGFDPVPIILPAAALDSLTTVIDLIEQDSVEAYLLRLEAFNGRLSGTDSCRAARDWIYGKLSDAGYDSLYIDTFTGLQLWGYTPVESYNVVATKIGSIYPDKHIVIGGHYDAVPGVPGADDDASGTVGVLAIAEAIAQLETEITIVMVTFDAEESGVWGSRHHAFGSASVGQDILFMINLDMIGNLPNHGHANLWTGPETGYARLWARLASELTGITGHLAGSVGSDNWPYMWNGYPVIFTEEYVWSDNYHLPSDSSSYINFDYLTRMAQTSLATLYVAGSSPPPVDVLSIENLGDGQSVEVNWVACDAPDLSHYVVYTAVDAVLLDSATVAAGNVTTVISGLTPQQIYAFAVRAVDTSGLTSYALDWEYLAPTTETESVSFTKVQSGWPVADGAESSGACFADVDDNGLLDIFVTSYGNYYGRGNRLYFNQGADVFEREFDDTLVNDFWSVSNGASLGDFDNDGDVDVLVTNRRDRGSWLYINQGSGAFDRSSGIMPLDGLYASGAGWADIDNDGYLDLVVTNENGINYLYHHNGSTLDRIGGGDIASDNYNSNCAVWGDYDDDGYVDLLVTNEGPARNRLYHNNGDGTFTRVYLGPLTTVSGDWRSANWGDYDNDGDLDVFVTGFGATSNALYRNDGGTYFEEHTTYTDQQVTDDSYGSSWGDYDNDGDLDLFVAVGDPNDFMATRNALYNNSGDGTFERVSTGSVVCEPGYSTGGIWGDLDRDGDLDLYVTRFDNLHNCLFNNDGTANHYLNINCVGTASNRSAYGTKVRMKATIDGQPVWQMREISAQSGYSSQNSPHAHFGLADALVADSVIFDWPSGLTEVYVNIPADSHLTVIEGSADIDSDGVFNHDDNCPSVYNPLQQDATGDGIGDACCCIVSSGNVDGDSGELVDIGDLTALIAYLYIPPNPTPICPNEANIDGDEESVVDIGDLTALIAYLYIPPNPEPAACM